MVYTEGRSTIFKSPNVAKSRHKFCSVFAVWFTSSTSDRRVGSIQKVGQKINTRRLFEDTRSEMNESSHVMESGIDQPKRISNPCILTYASAYMGSEKPV